MRRRIAGMITTVTVTTAMMLASVPAMAQEPVAECQPGPSNGATGSSVNASSVSEWDLVSLEQFAGFLANRYDVTIEEARARATITFDFCDKNLDGYACLQTKQRTVEDVQYSGGWLVEDNNYQLGLH